MAILDAFKEKNDKETDAMVGVWDSMTKTVAEKVKDTALWINPEIFEQAKDINEIGDIDNIGGGISDAFKKINDKIGEININDPIGKLTAEQPYLIEPVATLPDWVKPKWVEHEPDYILGGEGKKDPTLLSGVSESFVGGTISGHFPSVDGTDKDKQTFVNVAALTEIKSVADENGQYDAAAVESATKDLADYYTARATLDDKFGKGDGLHEDYDDKTQAAMDAGYKAALEELNKQYGEDTVSLYDATKEKIEVYKANERKYGSEFRAAQGPNGEIYRHIERNPDYNPDFAKESPDLADVAYAKGEMSAKDYKEVSGQEYNSNDPEKPYVATKDMCSKTSAWAQFHVTSEFGLDGLEDKGKELADKATDTFGRIKGALGVATAGGAAVTLSDKVKELCDKLKTNGHEFASNVKDKVDEVKKSDFFETAQSKFTDLVNKIKDGTPSVDRGANVDNDLANVGVDVNTIQRQTEQPAVETSSKYV